MLGISDALQSNVTMSPPKLGAHLFGVPDLGSIRVHDQQLLVAFARGKPNLLHPATMCWYSPEIISSIGN